LLVASEAFWLFTPLMMLMKTRWRAAPLRVAVILICACASFAWAADQPQWGHAWSRNMVSNEKGLPDAFDPKTGENILWSAKIGTETHSTPIVAGGRVYIGTNNGEPRDPKHKGDRGVLMCFDERTGDFLWQLVVPKRDEDPYFDWPRTGMASPATVEGERVYIVSNRGEVLCLDARGMANGNDGPFRDEAAHMTAPEPSGATPVAGAEIKPRTSHLPPGATLLEPGPLDADILWIFDLVSGAGIWPHDGAHSSILIHGEHLYLNTGTGVDNTHRRIRTPDAPSLVVLDKRTGRMLAREREGIAPNIFHSTWSPPSMGEVRGKPLLFFAGGNGIVYAFEPLPKDKRNNREVRSLSKIWQFDFDPDAPKRDVHKYTSNRREGPSTINGMTVFHQNRIYAAGGGDVWWGKNEAWLKCIDATKTGDITRTGLVWSYPLQKHVMSTPAVHDGMVFVADCGRSFHCVDAETGKPLWTHDIKGEVWASPLVADGKVYLGTRAGSFYVFAASKEKQLLSEIALGSPMSATVTAANGTLFVATMNTLYAVRKQ
jgi:outer membrane protein assembly factor BamB